MAANEQACLDGSVDDIVQRNQLRRIFFFNVNFSQVARGLAELKSTI